MHDLAPLPLKVVMPLPQVHLKTCLACFLMMKSLPFWHLVTWKTLWKEGKKVEKWWQLPNKVELSVNVMCSFFLQLPFVKRKDNWNCWNGTLLMIRYLEYPFFPPGDISPTEAVSSPCIKIASSSANAARLKGKISYINNHNNYNNPKQKVLQTILIQNTYTWLCFSYSERTSCTFTMTSSSWSSHFCKDFSLLWIYRSKLETQDWLIWIGNVE